MGFSNRAEIFYGLPTLCVQERRALYSDHAAARHRLHLEKQRVEVRSQQCFGSAAPDWAPSTGYPTGIADTSISQQKMICLLSADISYHGIGILSMTNLSCQFSSMKLTFVKCLFTRSGPTTCLSCLSDTQPHYPELPPFY